MSRQILTFLIVFVGIMLLMRTCTPDAPPPAAVPVEQVRDAGELFPLERGDVTVHLARDGSVVSVKQGETILVRNVPAVRRPFHFIVRLRDNRTLVMPKDGWTSAAVDGGRHFTCTDKAGLTVEKTVTLGADGLRLALKVNGASEEIAEFLLTAASGVPLTGGDDLSISDARWQVGGRPPNVMSFQSLVQAREDQGDSREEYARRFNLAAADKVELFGILGRDAFVGLKALPAVSELYVDVYRAKREDETTDEVEAWTSLVPRDGGYEGAFDFGWTPREKVATNEVSKKSQEFVLENDRFKIVFSNRGGVILGMWLKEFAQEAGQDPSPDTWIPILRRAVREGERPLTLRLTKPEIGTAFQVWDTTVLDDSIRFTLATRGWTITKTITLPEEGRYDLGVEIEVGRPDDSRASDVGFSLVGPAGSYVEDAFRGTFAAAPPAGFVFERSGGDDDEEPLPDLVKGDELHHTYTGGGRRGLWRAVGLRGAYFTCALVSPDPKNAATQAFIKGIQLTKEIERQNGETSRDSMLGRVSCSLDIGRGTGKESFRLYAGPNRIEEMREVGIDDAIDFGWFSVIGRFLMWLMKLLQGLVGSYGVAIMIMTLIVRGCLLPVSYKTQLGMQHYSRRLQKIKPILDELQKKHANNSQKLNQERMKVMKEHKVGFPLGCLMIFFQFPIWIALFSALRVEFDLLHEPFLWAIDLSMPDRLFALPFWPHYFNFFPILMLVLWVTQQKLAPSPAGSDPQVQMQMKMMKFMPFVFFFMLYNYGCALAVYMCVSSAWSIAEARFVRKAIGKLD